MVKDPDLESGDAEKYFEFVAKKLKVLEDESKNNDIGLVQIENCLGRPDDHFGPQTIQAQITGFDKEVDGIREQVKILELSQPRIEKQMEVINRRVEIGKSDTGAMLKHWMKSVSHKGNPSVPLMLVDRFKRVTGEKLFCQPLAVKTNNGRRLETWFGRLLS